MASVNVKEGGSMFQVMNYSLSLFLVIFSFFLFLNFLNTFSSHLTTDYNSCSTYNDKNTCIFCDGIKKRVLVGSECKCLGGWFDDSSNE